MSRISREHVKAVLTKGQIVRDRPCEATRSDVPPNFDSRELAAVTAAAYVFTDGVMMLTDDPSAATDGVLNIGGSSDTPKAHLLCCSSFRQAPPRRAAQERPCNGRQTIRCQGPAF